MTPEDVVRQGRETTMREDWSHEIRAVVEHAKAQLRERTTWEGDVREGPYIAGLMPPAPGQEYTVAVALKQDNDGRTFVWSPFELPWLNEYEAQR